MAAPARPWEQNLIGPQLFVRHADDDTEDKFLSTSRHDESRVDILGWHGRSLKDDPPECPICADDLLQSDPDGAPYILKCGHAFHEKCIRTWYETSRRTYPLKPPLCPYCRKPIVGTDMYPDHAIEFSATEREARVAWLKAETMLRERQAAHDAKKGATEANVKSLEAAKNKVKMLVHELAIWENKDEEPGPGEIFLDPEYFWRPARRAWEAAKHLRRAVATPPPRQEDAQVAANRAEVALWQRERVEEAQRWQAQGREMLRRRVEQQEERIRQDNR